MRYNLYTYDLLGNDQDGFEVNDVYLNTANIEIDECDLEADQTLFSALQSKGFVAKSVAFESCSFDWQEDLEGNFTIYIDYDGKPDCELRPIY